MTTQPFPLPQPVNWSKVAFFFTAAVTVAGWIAYGAQADQRISQLEIRTQPLAAGDLVRVQQDVAWIRQHMERDAR